ncbi:cytidylyltransferase domain-containing protein [Bacillus sp. AFS017336]|uniref:cytidylyltransferase domain-containing protein n=1 Tax=Bacillus sp. AFS017336 TaxID=2033489 RepID=UPI000BF01EB6|nr:glycosyltransferase family protein [Bacillus sp. AFS017336]PEK99089.1 acylneuraminate cytidylyltransferase [Bacillus sp. AFS017336]
MKVVAIIQARMGSTRLPGKVLLKVLNKPLLAYQIERVKRAKLIDEIVVATTTNEIDQKIVDFCEFMSISYYRGSEDDVLSRYFEAASLYNADLIVRITSDCPLIDPAIIDTVINEFKLNMDHIDYASNTVQRSFPIGMDIEVMSFSLIKTINQLQLPKSYREHVTPFIYRSHKYSIKQIVQNVNKSHIRLTVDTPEDFKLISTIIEEIYPTNPFFTLLDLYDLFDRKPELLTINHHIKQKQIEDFNGQ